MSLEEWLEDKIELAREDAIVTEKEAHNSYAADYDLGYLDALQDVLRRIRGQDE